MSFEWGSQEFVYSSHIIMRQIIGNAFLFHLCKDFTLLLISKCEHGGSTTKTHSSNLQYIIQGLYSNQIWLGKMVLLIDMEDMFLFDDVEGELGGRHSSHRNTGLG